ncbi:MAG: carboxypeptidase M32 [Pirellulales bacterium]|nr:carboxypeptidase M32 [Pirellulales bacterium]
MPVFDQTYQTLKEHLQQTAIFSSIEELLGWDERTLLPAQAGSYRADQMTVLAGLIHQRRTAPAVGEWLDTLESSLSTSHPADSPEAAEVREARRDYDRESKIPQKLVEELAKTSVLAQQAWAEARAQDNFAEFAPWLEKTLDLKRDQADALGYTDDPYDVLLDEFEPGETAANLRQVLSRLRDELAPLVAEIVATGKQAPVELLQRDYSIDKQKSFARFAAKSTGFDFDCGRIDLTVHPFCATLGPKDCRITTRYEENAFSSGFFSVLHEAGHGIYEQGLPDQEFGMPLGTATSLGIHESQSRLWENFVGRSFAFWEYFFPKLQLEFASTTRDIALDDFFFAINDVRPSLIRVEADEATYNLHILIRFELEQALLNQDLSVADLPGAWNEKYSEFLGVRPPDDAQGCLQDIHWSGGAIGYFPTYSLGNLYAAQLFESANSDLGALQDQFRRGEFGTLREWLRDKVHQHGRRYPAKQLVQDVCGEPLSHEPLIRHLRSKLQPLYGLA